MGKRREFMYVCMNFTALKFEFTVKLKYTVLEKDQLQLGLQKSPIANSNLLFSYTKTSV